MKYLNVETTKGVFKEVVWSVHDFPYERFAMEEIINKKRTSYYNIPCAFDIESTTIEPPKNGDGEYIYKPYSFMYHWQACIKDQVVFGRTWEEFTLFMCNLRSALGLSEKRKLVIYVHNLAYEFQFMKDFIEIDSIFAKDSRKPMKIDSNGIEFRCSYFLSNMSLSKFCENSNNVTYYKLDGDKYDYRKLRLPNTQMEEYELVYCYNDVRGLCQCIADKLEHDTIATIPLTSTGYVRREYRQSMNTKELRYNFIKCQLNEHDYKMLREAFRGGNTHANLRYSNVIMNNVWSFDISSSYPTCIAIDDFPIGKFTRAKVKTQKKLDYLCKNYCCVFTVQFKDIYIKKETAIPYIDIAHCNKYPLKKAINDNGRVLSADECTLTLTNIDLDIIRDTYNFKGFRVLDCIYAPKGKLPTELRKKMMEFFEGKTLLKGIADKEYEYAKSKNMLNATFGMCVTDICHSELEYDKETFEWIEKIPELGDALKDFYKGRNNFLWYQWGVFITANARKRLQVMLNKVGHDVVYIDTDSIKFVNEKHVAEFEAINVELIKQAESNDIPAYIDRIDIKEGKEVVTRFHLGTWDNDGAYIRFKTLGAKKYCYESKNKKGEKYFAITVSGMAKKKGAERVKCIENFQIGRTYSDIGRTTSWYNDEKPHNITINGCTFLTASNIGVTETTYKLGVTNEYWELIKGNGEYIV